MYEHHEIVEWASRAADNTRRVCSKDYETVAAAIRAGEAYEASGYDVRWVYIEVAGVAKGASYCGREYFDWALDAEKAADKQIPLPIDLPAPLRLVKVA